MTEISPPPSRVRWVPSSPSGGLAQHPSRSSMTSVTAAFSRQEQMQSSSTFCSSGADGLAGDGAVGEAFGVGEAGGFSGAGFGEELLQDGDGLVSEDAAGDLAAVIEIGGLKEIPKAAGCSTFRIGTTEDDAADATVDDGSGAHGAGFFGDVEITLVQAPITHGALGLGEGEHLGMGGGILQSLDLVPSSGDDLALMDDDGTDGHLVLIVSFSSLPEGLAHEVVVTVEVDERLDHGARRG